MSELDAPHPETPPPLAPPRFSLRAMMLSMVLVGVVLAAYKLVGMLAATVLVLFALAIAAHVAGNAIGSRLRDHGGRGIRETPAAPPSLTEEHFAPTTNLSHQHSLGWPMWAAIGGGAAVGGGLGIWLFLSTDAAKATWQDTALGALAFAALGAMAGFLIGSFAQVLVRALHQARKEQ